MKSSKLEKLEKKLKVATELVDEMTADVEEIEVDICPPGMPVVTQMVDGVATPVVIEEKEEIVFTLNDLKVDFMLIRNNIMKLVADGQRILSTASVIDVTDLKGSTIQALAGLQLAIGGNLKLLMDSYKIIVDIEKLRQKETKGNMPMGGPVNMGTVTTNNIIFNGSTKELLGIIHDNK